MITNAMIWVTEAVKEPTVITPFEEALLAGLVFIIMFGLGATLTPKDFKLAIKKPAGLIIGWVCQFGIMPLLAYFLVITFLMPLETASNKDVLFIAIGALLMGAVPAGTTSNIFTYFSKGNLALSVMMTANSTLWAIIMTPLALFVYGGFLFKDAEVQIPTENIVRTLAVLLVPVVVGMVIRKYSANIGAILELMGGFFGLFFIVFLMATWVPRNWVLLTSTNWQTYVVAIGLGLFGILIAYLIAKAIRVHPANARTIALETGIQNGPLAVAIILVTFRGNANIDQILLVPALYSLFIVIISTFVTFWFRRANIAQEQKIPNLL
jgi:BASS family bile acid:Na+ symporter